MLRTLILVLIVGGLALAGYRLLSGEQGSPEEAGAVGEAPVAETPAPASRQQPGEETARAEPSPKPEPAPEPAGDDEEPRRAGRVRDVTPEGVFSGPISPYRPRPAEAPPPEPEEPKSKRYFRVLVQDAGTLKAGTRTIRLAGIEATRGDAICTDGAGAEWPCGRAARAALTLFLRGRAIDCETVSGAGEAITARCRSGEEDLGGWLVAQGWAKPAEDGRYGEAGEAARRDRRGLYQAEWRGGAARSETGAVAGTSRAAPSLIQD